MVYGTLDQWSIATSGNWTDEHWSGDAPPTSSDTAEITSSGSVLVNIEETSIGNLIIDCNASLDIDGGGSLTVLNALDDSGAITVDPVENSAYFEVDGPARVESGGSITSDGNDATVDFSTIRSAMPATSALTVAAS